MANAAQGFGLAFTLLLSSTIACQADVQTDLRQAYIDMFGRSGGMNTLNAIGAQFQQYDRNGDGLQQSEIDVADAQFKAQGRAQFASMWLANDLDGDLRVTRDEVEILVSRQFAYGRQGAMSAEQKEQMKQQLRAQSATLMEVDIDKNGTIEGQELYQPQQRQNPQMIRDMERINPLRLAKALIAADPNQDGTLTLTEAAGLVATMLDSVESEADKQAKVASEQVSPAIAPCEKLPVTSSGDFVVVGGLTGRAVPSVTISGQDGMTSAVEIVIEPGETKIALLLLLQQPLIVKLSGAVQRVSQVLLSGPSSISDGDKVAAGVVGIEAKKVTFHKSQNASCFPSYFNLDGADAIVAKSLISKAAGRSPSQMIPHLGRVQLKVPSGSEASKRKDLLPPGMRLINGDSVTVLGKNGKIVAQQKLPQDWEYLERFPGGVMRLEPSEVISQVKAEPYIVLPDLAGLKQLENEKKIERIGKRNEWRARTKFTIPPQLTASTKFIVPKGVPLPDGNLDMMCVFSEEKASYIGRSCP
jgi:Ca2+-binding EF-hand superfamily protein